MFNKRAKCVQLLKFCDEKCTKSTLLTIVVAALNVFQCSHVMFYLMQVEGQTHKYVHYLKLLYYMNSFEMFSWRTTLIMFCFTGIENLVLTKGTIFNTE